MAPKFGYWKLRGLGQPIKLMLAYLEVEYEDKMYELDFDAWMAEKYTLGLVFPNLPYYIDEEKGLKMTHMIAIMRHLGREHGLVAEDEEAAVRQDMAEQQVSDFRKTVTQVCYQDWLDEAKKKQYMEVTLPQYLKEFSVFLDGHDWMAGSKLTYVDFLAYEFLDWALYLQPKCMDGHENLRNYMARFENLPKIKEYRASDTFMEWPLFYTTAHFGHKQTDRLPRYPDLKVDS